MIPTVTHLSRAVARQASRTFHSTPVARGGHGEGYDYLHAKYMYNLRNKPAAKGRTAFLIFGGVAVGAGIPVWAVRFNQQKAGLI